MSPRKNSALAAIEAQVCRDVGRGTQALIDASRGELAAAARALAGATGIGFITGFFVPRDDVAAPETDGPVGTALLAAALGACGIAVRIAVDSRAPMRCARPFTRQASMSPWTKSASSTDRVSSASPRPGARRA